LPFLKHLVGSSPLAVGRRLSWGILDQTLSSVTNAALSFLVARSVSQSSFGRFAVAFTVYTVVIGISRALVSQPLTQRFSGASPRSFQEAASRVRAAAVLCGGLAGAIVAVATLFLSPGLRAPLIALAATLPGLLMQDAWRYTFFAQGRPALAAINDLVWTVTQVITVGCVLRADWESPAGFLWAWGVAAAVAAGFGFVQGRSRPSLRGAWLWFRVHRRLTGYLVAQFVGVTGAYQGALLLLAGIDGVDTVGSLRAAQVMLGPLNILVAGVFAVVLPEVIRRGLDWPRRRIVAIVVSGAMTLVPLLWTLILLVMPYHWGEDLLGDSWPGGRSVLFASGVAYAAVGATLGPELILLALHRNKAVFWLSMALVPPLFGFGLVGVAIGEAQGAAIGFAVAQCLIAPLWWRHYQLLARRSTEPPTPPSTIVEGLVPSSG
jgi:O-antigen/teichoic acid export membrane protein